MVRSNSGFPLWCKCSLLAYSTTSWFIADPTHCGPLRLVYKFEFIFMYSSRWSEVLYLRDVSLLLMHLSSCSCLLTADEMLSCIGSSFLITAKHHELLSSPQKVMFYSWLSTSWFCLEVTKMNKRALDVIRLAALRFNIANNSQWSVIFMKMHKK